jgi:chromatin remodeling complex protein RSC6
MPANTGFNKTLTPSTELAQIVGSKPISRPDATKKLWDYIKKNKLQNPKNKREILADAKLEAVLGKKKVDMFQMTSLVSKHLKG